LVSETESLAISRVVKGNIFSMHRSINHSVPTLPPFSRTLQMLHA